MKSWAKRKSAMSTWRKADLIHALARSEAEALFWHEAHIDLAQTTGSPQVLPWDRGLKAAVEATYLDAEGATLLDLLSEVEREALRSIEKHGLQDEVPMGTGPKVLPLAFLADDRTAAHLADVARDEVDAAAQGRTDTPVTWRGILTEEVFEAFAEDDPARLRGELIQVAAVAVKMIALLDQQHELEGAGDATTEADSRLEVGGRA